MRSSITVFIAIVQWTHAQNMSIVEIDHFDGELEMNSLLYSEDDFDFNAFETGNLQLTHAQNMSIVKIDYFDGELEMNFKNFQ